jgi:flagellin
MRIQHNIMAMSAYRNYSNNTSAVAKNLERLSSGYKINRAGDDAAGLAISEKMRAQITGLNAAQKNVKDGISLVKTAEGAMQEIQDMLNRMDYLATQSANGTYDNDVDRAALQKEVEQLKSEINRIADSANFNGIKLLDGSLDAGTYTSKVDGSFSVGGTGVGALPAEGDVLGDNTVLHKGATAAGGDNAFGLELHNLSVTGDAGDTFSIQIGDETLTGTLKAAAVTTPLSAEDIAKALAGTDTTKIDFTLEDGTAFDPTAFSIGGGTFKAELSQSGTGVTFTQTDDTALNTVAFDVSITKGTDAAGGTPPTVTTAAGVDAGAGFTAAVTDTAGTPVTGANAVDLSAALDAAGAAALKAITTLNVGGVNVDLSGINVAAGTAAADAINEIQKAVDAAVEAHNNTGAAGTTDYTKIKNVAVTANGTTGFSIAFDTNQQTYAADAVAATSATATVDFTGKTGADVLGSTISIGDKTYEFVADAADVTAGNVAVVVADADDAAALAGKLETAAKAATPPADVTAANIAQGGNAGVDDMKVTFTTTTTGAAAKLDVVANDTTTDVAVTGNYNVKTTDQSLKADAAGERLASTKFTLTADMASNGSSIRIGDETYTFSSEKTNKPNTIYVGDLDLTDAADLATAAQRLTDTAVANTTYSVGQKDGVITVTERPGYTTGNQKYDLTTQKGIEESLGFSTATTTTGNGTALTLQIGDTSDDYNQLKVSVGDMHTTGAMNIANLNIGNQADAANAINTIRNAINYVSGIRGDLGATQNRLEHTANNLSVMAENIQDAESTIRDTDIAEEMMSYTKNNILVQSAQAMLAQANQVPQGVLQLLG